MNEVDLLRAALAVLKEAGVLRAQVKLSEGLDLSVEFPVELPEPVRGGDAPTPGGWKVPQSLDNPFDLEPDRK